MKIIVLSVILILCLNKSFADDCKKNNQRKENQNTVFLYLNCKEAQENCLKLDDQDKKTIDLVASSKVSLSVKSASLNSDNIVITFDKNSAKCLEKFTGDNVGKVIAIVARDIILINATIGAKMSDGLVQISMGSGTTNDQKLELCKSIFKNCQFNESSDKKNNTDLADLLFKHLPNDKDYAKMNQKYKDLMESDAWVTNKETITTYEKDDFKKGSLYKPAVISEGKHKGKKFFIVKQEFNQNDNKFIYKQDFIKTLGHGWIKREDIFPFNVLFGKEKLAATVKANAVVEKCPKESLVVLKAVFKIDEKGLQSFLLEKKMILRSHMVAFCAILGESFCQTEIQDNKNQLDKISCSEMFPK